MALIVVYVYSTGLSIVIRQSEDNLGAVGRIAPRIALGALKLRVILLAAVAR